MANSTDLVPERLREKSPSDVLFGSLDVVEIESVLQNVRHDAQRVLRDDWIVKKLPENGHAASQELFIEEIHAESVC